MTAATKRSVVRTVFTEATSVNIIASDTFTSFGEAFVVIRVPTGSQERRALTETKATGNPATHKTTLVRKLLGFGDQENRGLEPTLGCETTSTAGTSSGTFRAPTPAPAAWRTTFANVPRWA